MISLIMPVYNGEETVGRSIESVIAQTYTDWELIVVDNASSDGTRKIIKAYESKDKRVRGVECRDRGVVNARNVGLSVIKGHYVTFLDSDDMLKSNALLCVSRIIENGKYDIISYGYDIVKKNGDKIECLPRIQGECSNNEFFEELFSIGTLGFLWNKVYRVEIVHGISAPVDFELCEDLYINCEILLTDRKVFVLRKSLYSYFENDSSVTRTLSKKITNDYEWKYYQAYERIEALCKGDNLKKKRVLKAKLYVIKLGIEELEKNSGYSMAKKKLIRHMINNVINMIISDTTIRFKVGYMKVLLRNLFKEKFKCQNIL